MKRSSIIFSLCLALVAAAQLPYGFEVARWYNFYDAALTYSFDDNTKNQVPVAIPLLNRYGFKATFNVVTGWGPNWSSFKQAAQNGHEIASHTVSHVGYASDNELRQSKQTIEQNIGQECVTIAYPNCQASSQNDLRKYYIAGRVCSNQLVSDNIYDYYGISSLICGSTGLNSAQQLNQKAQQAKQMGQWAIYLIHGVDNDGGYSPISSSTLDSHFNYVKSDGRFWVATFKSVVKYILEAKNLVVTQNGNSISVSCNYQTSLTKLDQPVTLAKQYSGAAPTVTSSNGQRVNSWTYNGKIVFDVIPGQSYTIQ